MSGQSAGWTGLQLLVGWMKVLMSCGKDKRWKVIQMKEQYKGWIWVGGV